MLDQESSAKDADLGARAIVHVVGESAEIREDLRKLLESKSFHVNTHPSAEAFLDSGDPGDAGCVVLETRLPGMDGFELQQKLGERHLELPLIFLVNGSVGVRAAVDAMKRGAFDVIERPYDLDLLLNRVREAVARSLRDREEARLRAVAMSRLSTLTPRERQILSLVISGMTNKSIANRESISIKTVENHRARIMKKMKADSLAELVRLVLACR